MWCYITIFIGMPCHIFCRPLTNIYYLDSKTFMNACFQTTNNTPNMTWQPCITSWFSPTGSGVLMILSSTSKSFQFNMSSATYTFESELSIVSLIIPLTCAEKFHAMWLLTNMKSNILTYPFLYHFSKKLCVWKTVQLCCQILQDLNIPYYIYRPVVPLAMWKGLFTATLLHSCSSSHQW